MTLSDVLYNEFLRIRDKRLAEEERVFTAQILVKKVLLGFLDEWKTYSDCEINYTTDIVRYDKFIFRNNRLPSHLNTFLEVSAEIRATGILPASVPDRLLELATKMQSFLLMVKTNDDWDMNDPNSIPRKFDTLVSDVSEMYENFDNYYDRS